MIHGHLNRLLLLSFFVMQEAWSLRLQSVTVPQYKLRGESATLECDYQLQDDALYSLKWYKDNEEFYRYLPKSNPKQTSYKVDGVKVDPGLSSDKKVFLRSLNLKSSGVYRCEVSAEAPSFDSKHQEGRMEVVFLPRDGPHITGEERLYQVGDQIRLNCTSGKSYPKSNLHWYINDQEVHDHTLLEHHAPLEHAHGLVTTLLGLRFRVQRRHFEHGALRVRCVARVSPVLWEGGRESVVPAPVDTVREALFLVRGVTSCVRASVSLVAILTALVLTSST